MRKLHGIILVAIGILLVTYGAFAPLQTYSQKWITGVMPSGTVEEPVGVEGGKQRINFGCLVAGYTGSERVEVTITSHTGESYYKQFLLNHTIAVGTGTAFTFASLYRTRNEDLWLVPSLSKGTILSFNFKYYEHSGTLIHSKSGFCKIVESFEQPKGSFLINGKVRTFYDAVPTVEEAEVEITYIATASEQLIDRVKIEVAEYIEDAHPYWHPFAVTYLEKKDSVTWEGTYEFIEFGKYKLTGILYLTNLNILTEMEQQLNYQPHTATELSFSIVSVAGIVVAGIGLIIYVKKRRK